MPQLPIQTFTSLGLFGLPGGRADYKGARAYASAQKGCKQKTLVKNVNLSPPSYSTRSALGINHEVKVSTEAVNNSVDAILVNLPGSGLTCAVRA